MYSINEFLQWYWSGIIFVEDLKYSICKEWLLWMAGKMDGKNAKKIGLSKIVWSYTGKYDA